MSDRRALISVSNKEGVVDLAKGFSSLGIEIISTGGTASVLRKAGVRILEVSDITGFPEILDGRIKTLHPFIHAGILARREKKRHMDMLKMHGIDTIDIVVCNLYPFEETIQKTDADLEEILENIDIGGPTLLRAAAKNYRNVIVLTNPGQYSRVLEMLRSKKDVDIEERQRLAVEAFAHTARYDSIISGYQRNRFTHEILPETYTISMHKIQNMRYGENPHQQAAFYQAVPISKTACIANARQLHGKKLSFNNILDADCAIECVKEFLDPTCVIIKHATPCGIASSRNLLQAWKDAYANDVYSPFGGIVSFNRRIEEEVASELSNYFLEVIIAPDFTREALSILSRKKNLRLLKVKGLDKKRTMDDNGMDIRSVGGGFLVQEKDVKESVRENWRVVTKKKPSPKDFRSMEFAVKCVKHVRSNSVVFVKETRTVAIGGGQTSRVDAVWIATHKGKDNIRGSIMASDAFFPFRDAVDVAAKAGVKAIIQPGGSIRDNEVIKAADEHGIAMVFSGQRYFRH
ncbi:bifunctional phosphoribosylaminoimidazolecarboxamide formyltransferase/IMP cyclohydrolase [Euryarchaeota archaeon ex4484_162]|nr:MAG: bifunctional phosphoribosylaminoimidazolecarboxamide formyltransferase/IMP cyclohydrolase [Euryarchaeota archaeon ex4484_162]